ncbi:MAG TPA: UDP-3-O-(3-hydroxymyristoyl)glucosamine N-acyltransferase [Leptospiraceae bacterium]|nr:UDP-3-O-(3-hydroxymyristoyl)glucosamine N-acyltransferase [Leptospiraceae bacterium]HNF26215.1 UDP-3-O-(3-hydroxymyristoyl)glucosamine N-acyltransferase [Leptospiraceae bacterium]HNM04696.1 UDP-3-O-(3-hydroxymyristoyl)glucosamine N-acyltransferase [Leptospiraceae bacterium]HNO23682.1 UDP-3-O-(3-hydroxymyristoyl)glucosamine N-acyltransferase [Leptospiraceae bacterium]
MNIHTEEILKKFQPQGLLESVQGKAEIQNIAPVETGHSGDLVFLDKKEFLEFVIQNRPSAVVTSAEFADKVKDSADAVFISKNVGLAHAKIKTEYADRNWRDIEEWGRIHPSAVIHPTVSVPESCVIGPKVVIGKNVKLGENCVFQANVVIERDAVIGNDVILCPNVFIGWGCQIGNRVLIHPGSVVGGEGFGFSTDSEKHYHRIPQTGIVVIEDDVRIGTNCCFDRAAYTETRIKAGVKFDNLCHIAHNVIVGEDTVITAGGIVAGSTKVGKRVIMSGQAGVLDHLTIADDVILLVRPGVMSDVKKPGVYAGTPLMPMSDFMKSQSVFRNLAELKMKVGRIEKQLNPKSDNEKKEI